MATQTFNEKIAAAAAKRAAKVAHLRSQGRTWAEVGRILGVTRQRAQQIASRAGK